MEAPVGSFTQKTALLKAKERVVRSAHALVSDPKPNPTRQRYPDRYYRHYYFDRTVCEAIDFLARVNRVSRMQVATEMMRLGIGHYFAARIAEQNRLASGQRERGEPLRPTYFTVMLRHWAKQKGFDIRKFI